MKVNILQIHPHDNVATALGEITADTRACYSIEGNISAVIATDNIPFGHKISLSDIPEGTAIRKYGEIIGRATIDIRKGQHVHVHNVESLRGRGDLEDIEK